MADHPGARVQAQGLNDQMNMLSTLPHSPGTGPWEQAPPCRRHVLAAWKIYGCTLTAHFTCLGPPHLYFDKPLKSQVLGLCDPKLWKIPF